MVKYCKNYETIVYDHFHDIFIYSCYYFYIAPPPCKGTSLPKDCPFYIERFYEEEIMDFVSDGKRLNNVPSYFNAYKDDTDVLFSMIFSEVKNASACVVLNSATTQSIKQKANDLRMTHRIKTASCYFNAANQLRCMAVFCPKKELPNTVCDLYQSYNSYQSKVVNQLGKGYKVYQRKIYFDANGKIFVDVCYHKENKKRPFTVTLSDSISLASLTQAIERNERCGFYLIDGNARLEGNQMVFSAVFSTVKYGNCDYRVVYNLDALQLYERERAYSREGFHITSIIPTTGNLTPQFIAVFWH